MLTHRLLATEGRALEPRTARSSVLFGKGIAEERVIVITSTVEREFRDMNRRRWVPLGQMKFRRELPDFQKGWNARRKRLEF